MLRIHTRQVQVSSTMLYVGKDPRTLYGIATATRSHFIHYLFATQSYSKRVKPARVHRRLEKGTVIITIYRQREVLFKT